MRMNQKMVRRSRKEILLDILRILLNGPLKKTEIMYKCYLCWATLNESLETLVERKLIAKENSVSGKYIITAEGKEMLKRLDGC